MRKNAIWLVVILTFLAADPASAWFWEKKKVKAPEVTLAAKRKPAETRGERSLRERLRATGHRLGDFFRGVGREVKEISREVPGKAKKESKAVGKSWQDTGKVIAEKSKKVPGAFKEGAVDLGKGVKNLGQDIKEGTDKALKK